MPEKSSTETTRSRKPVAVGVRATKQRSAISDLLDDIEEFRSAQDLHDELRKRGEGIGLTTVYRTLQRLADAGEIDPGLVQKAFDRYKIDDPTATKGVKQEGGDA